MNRAMAILNETQTSKQELNSYTSFVFIIPLLFLLRAKPPLGLLLLLGLLLGLHCYNECNVNERKLIQRVLAFGALNCSTTAFVALRFCLLKLYHYY